MQPNQQPQPTQAPPSNKNTPAQKQAPSQSNPNSTQNSLEIASIRDGIVIMNDGTFRAVVMAKSINFDLMSNQEQDAVEYAYMSFLNSLYFDIQICIRSQKIDMGPYLEKMDKVRESTDNMLLGMLMEDYIFYIENLVEDTNIMSKQFYIVVPFSSITAKEALGSTRGLLSSITGGAKKSVIKIDETALENAKTELSNRVQNVVSGLMQFGIQSLPLDTPELIELYYNFYNPDTATRQTLQDTTQITVPLVSKGVGHAAPLNGSGNF
ncbi:hypothetical protein KA021_01470 [Candidatus Saccharibacteria bacterium]|nr:hypothetical protein [Candidatus Saccharibacteria bacterium]